MRWERGLQGRIAETDLKAVASEIFRKNEIKKTSAKDVLFCGEK